MTSALYVAVRGSSRVPVAKHYGEWTAKLPDEIIRRRHLGDLRAELSDRGYVVEKVSA